MENSCISADGCHAWAQFPIVACVDSSDTTYTSKSMPPVGCAFHGWPVKPRRLAPGDRGKAFPADASRAQT